MDFVFGVAEMEDKHTYILSAREFSPTPVIPDQMVNVLRNFGEYLKSKVLQTLNLVEDDPPPSRKFPPSSGKFPPSNPI